MNTAELLYHIGQIESNYQSAVEAAMAAKLAALRELYKTANDPAFKESGPSAPEPPSGFAPDEPRDHTARSLSDLVTPKQLGMIRALAREAGVDADEECRQVLRVRTEELSKKAASSFIDHLKGLQQSQRRAS